ncbi:MAG: hypothetical protein H7Y38_13890 [Armatimonadetes bacterium]|nr:hypothetical protein [Armatimonadota bacterium]
MPTPVPTPVPTPAPTPTPPAPVYVAPTFTIRWNGRSRTIATPSSALSVVLTLSNARIDGTDAATVANRDAANIAAHDASFRFPVLVVAGTHPLRVRFYAAPNGTGALVAEADALATIDAEGRGIGNITPVGRIVRVAIPEQTIAYPGKKELFFAAGDAQNTLVAVTPGSAFWTVTEGADFLRITPDHFGEGLQSGTARVVATVDGVRSEPSPVRVVSTARVVITPERPEVSVRGVLRLSALVENLPPSLQGVSWSVAGDPAIVGTVDADGTYHAPAKPGDFVVSARSSHEPGVSASVTVRVRGGSLPVIIE